MKIKSLTMIITFSLFLSCVKKQEESDKDTVSSADSFLVTGMANDLGNIADEAGRTKSVSSFKTAEAGAWISGCATLKFDTVIVSNPDTVTVDFGNSNCQGNDGRNRRGSIQVVYTGKYRDSLTVITITPVNYFVNDHSVKGSKSVRNMGHNAQGYLVYEISEHITVVKAEGGSVTHEGKFIREWMNGEGTVSWADDIYYLSGTSNGTSSDGKSYRANITKKLVRLMTPGCRRYFVSGIIELMPANRATRTIDFGDGSCDNEAVVTINGKTYTVQLP
jgi:hypothetical protein